MQNLGAALLARYGRGRNKPGGDYLVVDRGDGNGEVIVEWRLPDTPPGDQAAVDQMLATYKENLVEIEASSEPDWPSYYERIDALETNKPQVKQKMNEIRQRVRDRGPSNRPPSPPGRP